MTNADERIRTAAAARAALHEQEFGAREAADDGRRRYHHEDFIYDRTQQACWVKGSGRLWQREAVNAAVPPEWRRVVAGNAAPAPEEGAAPRGRGRPAGGARERVIPAYDDILNGEFGDLSVEDSTWWPGHPEIIRDVQITVAGAQPAPGDRLYNTYRPPVEMPGKAENAGLWVEHIRKLWPEPLEHEYFFDYCAHMVQRPYEKCNTAIVLSGAQGIGKDAALVPLARAVGGMNYQSIDPDMIFSAFKPWTQAVMLLVNEVRPSSDEHRATDFYNVMKTYIVAPPEGLLMNEKHVKARYVVNVIRVFMTTNDRMAMYMPAEDRRMHIMHSELPPQWEVAAGDAGYFDRLFGWLTKDGGTGDVIAWLKARDLSQFSPTKQPEKTNGWRAVATGWGEPDDGVTCALEHLGRPEVVFGAEMADPNFDDYEDVMRLLKSRHRFINRMGNSKYDPVVAQDGKPFKFTRNGGVFKSSSAFKLRTAALTDEAALQRLTERGYTLAAAKADR